MVGIFVFGTLKKDFPNFRFNSGVRLDGCFTTVERYPLYLIGPRHSPWMVNNPGVGFKVEGEIFEVDSDGLKIMDKLERIDEKDGYERLVVSVQSRMNDEIRDVFAYLKPMQLYVDEFRAGNVRSGPWDCYTVEHSLLYRSRNHAE